VCLGHLSIVNAGLLNLWSGLFEV